MILFQEQYLHLHCKIVVLVRVQSAETQCCLSHSLERLGYTMPVRPFLENKSCPTMLGTHFSHTLGPAIAKFPVELVFFNWIVAIPMY